MIKGKTKIELKNSTTNELNVIEHDNLITDFITDLSKFGSISSNVNLRNIIGANTNTYLLAHEIFGGVLLFEDLLSDGPTDYELPSDNNIIGHGIMNITPTSGYTDLKMGTYNTSESGIQSDGSIKFVYDFSTDQANGIISAIALCPKTCGYYGQDVTNAGKINYVGVTYSTVVSNTPTYIPIFRKNEYMYYIKSASITSQYITFYKVNMSASSIVTLHDIMGTVTDDAIISYAKEVTVDLGASSLQYYIYMLCDDSYLYIFPQRTVSAGASVSVKKISLSDLTVSNMTFTNNMGVIFYPENACLCGNGYVYYANDHINIYKINMHDLTDIVSAPCSITLTKKFFTENKIFAEPNYVIDMDTLDISYIPKDCTSYLAKVIGGDLFNNKISKWATSGSSLSYTVIPFYLSTKNNLDEFVTKTASQTMKVTYTLSES